MGLWSWARRGTQVVSPSPDEETVGASVQHAPTDAAPISNLSLRASFLDIEAVRKLSIAAGAFTPDAPELKVDPRSTGATDSTANSSRAPPATTSPDTSDKISLIAHAGHSNSRAALTSVPAAALVYFVYAYLSIVIPAAGGMWGDRHAVLCAACISGIEAMLLAVWRFERGYVLRRVLCCAPALLLTFMLTSKFAFGDRPGHWTSALMTASWAVGCISTWPWQPAPRPTFVQHVKKSAIIALLGHGAFIVVIFGQIIPTKHLSHSNPVLTSLVTGIAFPFLTWVGGVRTFDLFVKAFSSALALTPCVLNYLNTSIKLAVLSAVLQMITEILGKIWIVYFTRKTFADCIAAVGGEIKDSTKVDFVPSTSEEPGELQVPDDGADISNSAVLDKKKKDIEVSLDQALFMMASRWNAELAAEKVGIIAASLIAIVAFDTKDGVGLKTDELIFVAFIFFGMEVITDAAFVYMMDTYFHVPILSKAINESDLFTKNALVDSGVICLMFVSIASCIKMALMV